MKFDYCAMHTGAVVGGLELSCLAIRRDDAITCARMLERFARHQRGSEK